VHGTPNAGQPAGMRSAKELIFTGARQAAEHTTGPGQLMGRGARYAPPWTLTSRRLATRVCCCGAAWSTSRPCPPTSRGRAPGNRPGSFTQVLTGWLPTWCPGPQARQRSGAAVSTWSGTTRSSATCCVTWACWTVRPSAAAWLQERCPAGP
jgi:hypothetical protein